MRTLFIGDLHLSADRPDITHAFSQFLLAIPTDTDALYIIGDLFEVWVGDDIAEPFALDLAEQLLQLSQRLPIYYIHGNRDFMLGKAFAKRAGLTLLPQHYATTIYGKTCLILHGDSLCTLDLAYQRFRRFRNIRLFRWLYGQLPRSKRLAIAANIRAKSQQGNSKKSMQIMDVEPASVDSLMAQYQSEWMIHGHTHRPAIHSLAHGKQRLVVGDWYHQTSVLTLTPQGASLSQLPLSSQPVID
ncbi:UDP-2,3-diacylglucosamine diphosphatase [Shewanella sp. NIFS-20-20]|uniref:UDP-2,3-diacylglucosamine diphosphatase n=1 Tax=Shewanella sp. NIFS-20-20 TaxID=2853806 RepID=UPI001C472FB4|nr:UDP-2,3-diacylglucosamine diphosphatase [Shewanella sp. NIFS-20-20]MBV7315924.1 UDP-2,3-diacylglucosamine diphosphatase [Shewanella sp. NIFS-20-20]